MDGDAAAPRRGGILLATGGVASLLLVGAIAGVLQGPVDLPVDEVLRVVGTRLWAGTPLGEIGPVERIVWDGRVPRVIMAALVGASLGLVGATLQTAVRNPLADPYVIGVAGGATLGAVIVVAVAPPMLANVGRSTAAFAGATLSFVAVVGLARSRSGTPPERLVLAGVVLGAALSALTSYVVFLSGTAEAAQAVLFWLLGSLGGVRWSDVGLPAGVLVVGASVLLIHARHLDALAAGDDVAASLGIEVERARWTVITVACLLTGTAVAVAGAIGFVGLVVPHLVRIVVGVSHRRVLAGSILVGATLLVYVDLAARTLIGSRELPLSVLTALLGAPVFLGLQRRRLAS